MRLGILTLFGSILLLAGVHAGATQYTFAPTPADLQDLDHNYFYSWKINWTLPGDQQITGARLSILNINNWDQASNILYINLLNTPPTLAETVSSNVTRALDNSGGGNNFSGPGVTLLTTYTDLNGAPGPAENFSYNLTQPQLDILKTYLGNSLFGFGFDPDCHYFNSGVQFDVWTSPSVIPEPATLALTALGLGALSALRRRKK